MAKELHRELQDLLGDSYEVIFESEGFQIRRAGDRAFIAEFEPNKGQVRAGPHVLFPGRENADREALKKQGRTAMEKGLSEWRDHGFEELEEGHIMTMDEASQGVHTSEMPRYIQPMAKHVSSPEEAAEAIQWIRKHRKFD